MYIWEQKIYILILAYVSNKNRIFFMGMFLFSVIHTENQHKI